MLTGGASGPAFLPFVLVSSFVDIDKLNNQRKRILSVHDFVTQKAKYFQFL
jgi:hypothetical protein